MTGKTIDEVINSNNVELKNVLDKYQDDFKKKVISHLDLMNKEEWDNYRLNAQFGHKVIDNVPYQNLSRNEVVYESCSTIYDIDSDFYGDWSPFVNKKIVIGSINNIPIYYVEGQGLYVFKSIEGVVFEVNLSWPCYPEAW